MNCLFCSDEDFCSGPIDDNVFYHTIIIGIACIPTSFWLPLCVHRLGTKFFLGISRIFTNPNFGRHSYLFIHLFSFQFAVFSLVVAAAVTIGLRFVRNSTQNLILSCIFEALTSLGISTVYCVMVDLFPTNLRFVSSAVRPLNELSKIAFFFHSTFFFAE